MRTVRPGGWRWLTLVLVGGATPAVAHAHSVGKNLGDFYWGLLHPIASLESVLPLIAIGLLAGQQGADKARWMIGLLWIGLSLGPLMTMTMGDPSMVSWVNLGSFVVLGGMLALGRSWPIGLLCGMGLYFGLVQGWGNTVEMSQARAPLHFAIGMVVGGGLLVLLLAAGTSNVGKGPEWQKIGLRIAGSWIAAIGLMVMALR